MATRILMIRHADVENPHRILYGHIPGFNLSALGRAQAAAVGEQLRNADVRRIVHSPLDRARETAAIIASKLERLVPLTASDELREADFSRYLQGVPYWQIPIRRPLWFVHKARRGLVPGDEPMSRLGGRVLAVARCLAERHPGEVSVLVSHADPLQAAWVLIDGRPQTEREMYRKVVDRAGILEVAVDQGEVSFVSYTKPPDVRPAPAAAGTAGSTP